MIELDDVTIELDGRRVVEDVSVSVESGELLGLIGPNGTGKTTLLRAIDGILPTVAGTITVDGDPIDALGRRAIGRRIAMVPQSTNLPFAFTVEEVVAMGRTPYHGRVSAEDPAGPGAIERALAATELDALADRPVTELSGGERQRVLIARALAQDTPAVLLDEPTANLDIRHQVTTAELVRAAADDGRAAIAAIHDLSLASRYCDRLLLLGDGRPIARGEPADVLTREHLREAFDAETAIYEDPATGHRTVTPLAPRDPNQTTVVVLGGHERASATIRTLHDAGYRLVVGLASHDDRAGDVARALGLPVIAPPRVREFPDTSLDAQIEAVHDADATVLADVDRDAVALLSVALEAERPVLLDDREDDPTEQLPPPATSHYRTLRNRAILATEDDLRESIAIALERPHRLDREV